MHKVIFHLDEEEKVEAAFSNIANLYNDIESEDEELKVELLVNSSGVKPFKAENDEHIDKIVELQERGLKIAICNNTLKALELQKQDLIKEVFIVKSGVGELTRKQNNGWAYIKP